VSLQLPRLPTKYTPDEFQFWWQQIAEAIEANELRQDEAIAAIEAAQAAADNANAAAAAANEAAEEITAGTALSTSFVENFTPPVVSADNTGLVTIANHDRHYGDGTIVAVTGDTLATGEASPTRVHIYYSDPSRAGGAVTYQYSTDEADAAQIGDVHNVGAVEIPAAGTQSGGYARPPGYGGFEP
jgi:hypothetical protein